MSQRQDDGVEKRRLDTTSKNPAIEVAEVVSEIENEEPNEMNTVWDCIDGMLENIFSDPPAPHAEMQVSFNYEGYRITVDQNGTAWFDKQD